MLLEKKSENSGNKILIAEKSKKSKIGLENCLKFKNRKKKLREKFKKLKNCLKNSLQEKKTENS